MLARKLWRRKCALATAALLLVVPASAQDPAPPQADSGETESDEASGDEEVGEPEGEEPDAEEPALDTSIQSDKLD